MLGTARALFLWIGTARALYLLQLPMLANYRRYGAPAVPLRQGSQYFYVFTKKHVKSNTLFYTSDKTKFPI